MMLKDRKAYNRLSKMIKDEASLSREKMKVLDIKNLYKCS